MLSSRLVFNVLLVLGASLILSPLVGPPQLHWMLGRILNAGRSFATGRTPNLSSTNLSGDPVQPTVATAIAAHEAMATNGAQNGSGQSDIATVASGCFWGTEHIYREYFGKGKGLIDAKAGFIGGKDSSKNPSYEEVCTGRTGHAEATQIKFDPSKVSYAELVEFFYRSHDPTQLNAQGNDRGTQYRSALFPHNDEQTSIVKKVTQEVQEKHFTPKGKKLATTIEERPASAFFVAEDYHQEYLHKNPWGYQCSTHRLWW